MNFLKVKILIIILTATTYSSPNSKHLDMVLSHFVIMVQNCGTPSQQRLRSLNIYTALRKMLLNGAHRLNVMCSSYNDIHDTNVYMYKCMYICMYIFVYIYIILYEIYHIISLVLSVFIIQLHVNFIEPSRFICKIYDVECFVYF